MVLRAAWNPAGDVAEATRSDVAVVGKTAGASVVVAFLQHVARPVLIVVRLPSVGSQCESSLDRQSKDRDVRLVM